MQLITKALILLVSSSYLTACGMYGVVESAANKARENKQNQYLASEEGREIHIPESVSNEKISDQFQLSAVSGSPGASVLPPESLIEKAKLSESLPLTKPLSPEQFKFVEQAGEPHLILNLSFEQAWLAVNSAMRRQKMNVVNADKDNQYFQAMRLYGASGRLSREKVPHTIVLKPFDNGVQVVVQTDEGEPASPHYAHSFLTSLSNGLRG